MDGPAKTARIEIDQDSCIGCKSCVEACFMDVIHWDEELERSFAAYPEDCQWCLFCEDTCSDLYNPNLPGRDFFLNIEKEINEGRGPIYIDVDKSMIKNQTEILQTKSHWPRGKFTSIERRHMDKVKKYGKNPVPRAEAGFKVMGSCSAVLVDHHMKTTLEGLWAIGDASMGGSSWPGAIVAPPGGMCGSGLGNAMRYQA